MQKDDPFKDLDLSDIDKDLRDEERAARVQGLDRPEPELVADFTLEPDVKDTKHKEPWLRRDYTPYHEAWDKIITAPGATAIPYASEQHARNARSEFYKARAQFKATQGDTYPKHMELLAHMAISLRRATDRKSGKPLFVLVFIRQPAVPDEVQSYEEISKLVEFDPNG
jgi:hypothetical protein